MLSIAECRQLLQTPELTDQEIKELRDFSYALADAALLEFFNPKRQCRPTWEPNTPVKN